MDSELSESPVSSETAKRRTSSDVFGPLSGKPHGTTPNAQVGKNCLQAGQLPNKTPIFISGYSDVRAFLAWLRETCPGGLTAQLKGENLMVVPSTAEAFRAAIRTLRSLDRQEGVSFHTFTLTEDRCVRLLVKNLGRVMSESVVREELELLDIHVQGLTQLRSGRRDQDHAKDRLSLLTLSSRRREGQGCQRCVHSPSSVACECRWKRTWLQKDRCNASAASASATRSETVDTHPGASSVGAPTFPVGALPRGNGLSAAAAGETTRRTTVGVLSGRKRGQSLQSRVRA
jgi:hypothetical protein